MKVLRKAVMVAVLGCFIGQMSGCASSNLADVWQDPSYKAAPLSKILVIAVRKDAAKRRIWEDAFTNELAKHGMSAISSYSLFADTPPDTDQLISTVRANGFDGIMVVLRRPTETNRYNIQGYTSTEQNVRYSSYWPIYWTYYRDIVHPGYVDSETVDIRSIDLSTTGNNGRLIWSARSRTQEPAAVTDVQDGIVSLVMSELEQRDIIKAKK